MLLYTSHNCSRFRYACEIVLQDYEGAWEITSDKDRFVLYDGVKLEYGVSRQFENTFFIPDIDILWNNQIVLHEIAAGRWKGIPTLYAASGDIEFDIFSANFFLVSRYEEYLDFEGDSMGRFTALQSTASKHKFLHRPIIDLWRASFYTELKLRFPSCSFRQPEFSFLSTIDVDSAFAYKHKGFKRTIGGVVKDLVRFDFINLKQRVLTLNGNRPDIYDTYDYIESTCKNVSVNNLYFFLLANFGQYDKNVPHRSQALRSLIKRLIFQGNVGIHPGVSSNSSFELLSGEKERLEAITETPCIMARQHYLMLFFPFTYRSYLKVGIENDYTMGFADDVGFRAGTSRPFFWFDLERNEKTLLKVYPFAAMDTTMKNYLKLSPEDAISLTNETMKDVSSVGGSFISLWHNETLSESHGWEGWRIVWESTLRLAQSLSKQD